MITPVSLHGKLVAEATGTAFLLIAVVGSGILGQRLENDSVGLALLANALTTGAMLFVLIRWLEPLSGAHFNPLVTLVFAVRREIGIRDTILYLSSQVIGGIIGVGLADAMFEAPLYAFATHARGGFSASLGEFVATFGLIGVVWTCTRRREFSVAGVVGAYVFAAFWFSPTGFANPAVTLARTLTNTSPGIRPSEVPAYLAAEIAGAVAAGIMFRRRLPDRSMRPPM